MSCVFVTVLIRPLANYSVSFLSFCCLRISFCLSPYKQQVGFVFSPVWLHLCQLVCLLLRVLLPSPLPTQWLISRFCLSFCSSPDVFSYIHFSAFLSSPPVRTCNEILCLSVCWPLITPCTKLASSYSVLCLSLHSLFFVFVPIHRCENLSFLSTFLQTGSCFEEPPLWLHFHL